MPRKCKKAQDLKLSEEVGCSEDAGAAPLSSEQLDCREDQGASPVPSISSNDITYDNNELDKFYSVGPNGQDSESKSSPDLTFSPLCALAILCELVDHIGMLGTSFFQLLKDADQLQKDGKSPMSIFDTSENLSLVFFAISKLKKIAKSDDLDNDDKMLLFPGIDAIETLIKHISKTKERESGKKIKSEVKEVQLVDPSKIVTLFETLTKNSDNAKVDEANEGSKTDVTDVQQHKQQPLHETKKFPQRNNIKNLSNISPIQKVELAREATKKLYQKDVNKNTLQSKRDSTVLCDMDSHSSNQREDSFGLKKQKVERENTREKIGPSKGTDDKSPENANKFDMDGIKEDLEAIAQMTSGMKKSEVEFHLSRALASGGIIPDINDMVRIMKFIEEHHRKIERDHRGETSIPNVENDQKTHRSARHEREERSSNTERKKYGSEKRIYRSSDHNQRDNDRPSTSYNDQSDSRSSRNCEGKGRQWNFEFSGRGKKKKLRTQVLSFMNDLDDHTQDMLTGYLNKFADSVKKK